MASQTTDFTLDVLGRFLCNTLDEAQNSANPNGSRRFPDGSFHSPQNDARPFDVIVVGGGSFGLAFAQHLFSADSTHSHRILVLDAGSLVLTEHVQNLPILGLNVPGPVVSDPGQAREQIWGLPWRSDVRFGFTGLAYSLGGRSVFFGGWSPRLLDAEMPSPPWPAAVKGDLQASDGHFDRAAGQIGTDSANDFISGPLHEALRQQLFDGLAAGRVADALPLAELPLHLAESNGLPSAAQDLLKLEAPLAVQGRTVSGLFPVNKYSALPLLIQASRTAAFDSQQGMPFPDDVKKRFIIVPQCHVVRLLTQVANGQGRVTGIEVATRGQRVTIPVAPGAKVVIALGTLESARLALLSFPGIAGYDRIGTNLMAHLRSNLTIRIPRTALGSLDPSVTALQASALFVKGRHDFGDGTSGYFHHQITAAGLDRPGSNSEAELFKKIPDIDTFDALRRAHDDRVVITIRGIGEIRSGNAGNRVTLAAETDEFGVARAFVHLAPSARDRELWDAMDRSADDVARVFAGGKPFEVLGADGNFVPVGPAADLQAVLPYVFVADGGRRDGLGTTHHEAGTLAMGEDPATSATDPDGRFHGVENAYATGPALFPTLGSPNPMLTGVALARRLAERLTVPRFTPDPGFRLLFDGVATDKWRMSKIKNQPGRDNPGTFLVVDRTLESLPGTDLGLFWHTDPTPADFILKLEWLRFRDDDNSGVFLRFPHPDSKGYDNTAYVAVNFGFEVQIDQLARDDGAAIHKTGAIYGLSGPVGALPVAPAGEWNEFEIHAVGQLYTVFLNGQKINEFLNPDPGRGTASPAFIGLQAHTGRVAFRRIQIKEVL
jgi:3-keto-disaccharide hydrolase/GMC oxidoreductase